METKKPKKNTTRKKVAIPMHKFYSAFLRNGLIKMGQGEEDCTLGKFYNEMIETGKEPTKMTIAKLLYNYGCLYKTLGEIHKDLDVVYEAYKRAMRELGKENPNNELYILHNKGKYFTD